MKPSGLYFANAIIIPVVIIIGDVLTASPAKQSELLPLAIIWFLLNAIVVAANYKKPNVRSLALAAFSGLLMGIVLIAISRIIMPNGKIPNLHLPNF